MKRFDLWKLSLLNVFASPVRSLLTVLGFAIGVASILAVLTLGDAGHQEVQKEMSRLGIDKVWLTPEGNTALPLGSGQWLAAMTGASADEITYLPVSVSTENGKTSQVTAIGCESTYLKNVVLLEGQPLAPAEWNRHSSKLLMGTALANELEIQIGQYARVGERLFEICGIIGAADGVTSVPFEKTILLPIAYLSTLTKNTIQEIQLTAPMDTLLTKVQQQSVLLMNTQGYQVNAVTMQVQMEAAESVVLTFVNVLKWIAAICVLVGGVGVMNILLVGVRERRREIGVMKSIGTTPTQICILFLLEAAVYALLGAFLGLAVGAVLCFAAGKSIQLHAVIRLKDASIVFFSAVLAGVCFGVLPALKASLLSCVDALRQD